MIRLHAILVAWCWGVYTCAAAPPEPSPPAAPLPPKTPPQPPQVLVSVKYNPRGAVDGLVVAQYRVAAPADAGVGAPNVTGDADWYPTLSNRELICTDLCTAGLGGSACGQTCENLTPSQLLEINKSKLDEKKYNEVQAESDRKRADSFKRHFSEKRKMLERYKGYSDNDAEDNGPSLENAMDDKQTGTKPNSSTIDSQKTENGVNMYNNAPRVEVCPTLCANDLGWPLCECSSAPPTSWPLWAAPTDKRAANLRWEAICSSFCPLSLRGCPACAPNDPDTFANRKGGYSMYSAQSEVQLLLNTNAGWVEWCTFQCSRGDGGAACNCDRAPFF